MKDTARILIVGETAETTGPLAAYLLRYGFQVACAENGRRMHEMLSGGHVDLIVLDVLLPGENGLSLCRFVREHLATPVILLSTLGEIADRVAGLEIGADDDLVKPFDPRELVARIRSVLRRTRQASTPASQPCYCFAGWRMDIEKRELRNQQDEQPLELGTAEFRLLRALLENPNTILSRERLLDLTSGGEETSVFDRSIDSQISRLRRKLRDNARTPRLLRTVRGGGYMLAADVSCRPS